MYIAVSEFCKLVSAAEELRKNGEWSWDDSTEPMFIGNDATLRNLNPRWVARQSLISGKPVINVILHAAETITNMQDIVGTVKADSPQVLRFSVRKEKQMTTSDLCEHNRVEVSPPLISCCSSPQGAEDPKLEIRAAWQVLNKLIESHQNNAEDSKIKQTRKGYWARIVDLMSGYSRGDDFCDETFVSEPGIAVARKNMDTDQKKIHLDPLCPLPGGYHNVPVLHLSGNLNIDEINNILAQQKANFRVRAKVEKKLAEAAPADQPSLRNMVEAQPPLVIFGATGHEINLKWIRWYIMTTQCSKESAFFTAESILKRLVNN